MKSCSARLVNLRDSPPLGIFEPYGRFHLRYFWQYGSRPVVSAVLDDWHYGSTKPAAICPDLGKLLLQYEPGAQWHYSVSVDVQGRLVEVLSGMSFGEFLKTRLFEPLDMRYSVFCSFRKAIRLAQLYKPAGLTELNFMAPTTGKA